MSHRRKKRPIHNASRRPQIARGAARRKHKRGAGIANSIINALPIELHYRGFDTGFKSYNFAGPGTKLNERLGLNKQPLANSQPVNRVDQAALENDLFYDKYPDHESRKSADNKMIDQLANVRNDSNARWTERADATIVEGLMRTKRFLGLGRKKRKRVIK